jgi:hypothetical protein
MSVFHVRFGMVLYNASGDFFHGYHEADTGLVRPYGLAMVQASDPGYLAVSAQFKSKKMPNSED